VGVWTTDSATLARPLTDERLPEYAPDPAQRFVWVATYRNPQAQGNWFGRSVGRRVVRLMCFLGRLTTPAPYDLMGAEFSEEAACRHCDDPDWSVVALPVGATFPKERVRWRWNYSPRRLLNWNREGRRDVPLYERVPVSELEAARSELEEVRRIAAG